MRALLSVALIVIVACAAPAASSKSVAAPAPAASSPDIAQINAVLVQFQAALVARDSAAMSALMLAPDVPFVGRQVATGKVSSSTAAEFAADVAAATTRWEEQFSEVVILARDGVATLDASYRFLEDGRVTNHGREVWTLVETADGWKIGSVTWSVIID